MTPLIVAFIVLLSSRCDSLRDRHFDPERRTRWRQPIPALGGVDPWHLIKWLSFYPPLIALCVFGYGLPWSSWASAAWWAGTTVGAWIAWRWGAPWKSVWIPR